MPPAVVRGQYLRQGGQQVGVAARPEFHQRQSGGGVRHEHVQQPVAALRRRGGERGAGGRDVVHALAPPGGDADYFAFHAKRLWQRLPVAATGLTGVRRPAGRRYLLPLFLRVAPRLAPAPAVPLPRPVAFAPDAAFRAPPPRALASTSASGPGNTSPVCPSSKRTR